MKKILLGSLSLAIAFTTFGQNYYLFNDSVKNNWNVKILNYLEGKNFNRLLLSYQNAENENFYPAIGEYLNGRIKITQAFSNETIINFYKPVIKPDNGLLLPLTTINGDKYYYDLKDLDKKGESTNVINLLIYPYQILSGGIYPLQNETFLDISTIQKEPDNPGQSSFYNVWFKRFEFDKTTSYRKVIKNDLRIKSPFNEEAIAACKGNDTMAYILVRRYTKKDFSAYEGILYAVGFSGTVLWKESIFWDENHTLSIFSYNGGVVLCDGYGSQSFLLPNTTSLSYYDLNGKTDKALFVDKFVAACGIETSTKNMLIAGAEYKTDSLFRVIVKKSKTVMLDKEFNVISEDVLDFYEGPDGELTRMQFATSNEILSVTELKDKSFIMTGSVYKPTSTDIIAGRVHYGMLLYADKFGKMDKSYST